MSGQIKEGSQKDGKSPIRSRLFNSWFEFATKTSGHGFFKLVESTHKQYFMWIVILCFTLIGLFGLAISLLIQYFSYSLIAEVEITSDNQFVMPDITVCPRQRLFFSERFNNTPNDVILFESMSYKDVVAKYVSIWTKAGLGSVALKLTRFSLIEKSNKFNVLRGRYDIIIKLNYRQRNISLENLHFLIRPDGYRCVTFQPEDTSLSSLEELDDTFMIVFLPMVGSDDRYESITQTSLELEKMIQGASVFLHPRRVMPDFEVDDFVVLRSYLTQMAVEQTEDIISDTNDRCAKKVKGIKLWQNRRIKYFRYSRSLCFNVRMQINIYNACRCVSEELFWPAEIPKTEATCHLIPDMLLKETNKSRLQNQIYILKEMHDCHDRIKDQFREENEQQWCPRPCQIVSYSFDKAAVFLWNSDDQFAPVITDTVGELETNLKKENKSTAQGRILRRSIGSGGNSLYIQLAFISITPKTFFLKRIREVIVYDIGNFFSDFGGTMGLFMGFSVITLSEFAELFCHLISCLFEQRRDNRVSQS